MRIGSYEIFAIETGEFALDGGAMFGVVPKTLWGKKIPVDEKNRIDMRLRCLLLQGDGRNILIDCGMGEKWDAKMRDIYRLDTSRYSIEKSLASHGLKTSDITDVILTHLHFDHAGGSTYKDNNGKLLPTFPKATYIVQKENLDWARNPTEKDRASYLKDDWEPLVQAGVLKIVDGEKEILPGIHTKLFYGHTRAIQLPFLDDGKTKLFFCGDVIPTSVHLGPPWIMAYDNFPLITLEEKKKILKQAAAEKWILVFEHCPLISAAQIEAAEKGYQVTQGHL
ncbi:MAG: MBL fold metallo-hydrolase [Deltaproteobacteria bacterium]|nr:MBL fold metallo-hydrolase [Deltaproteobacteria bacterium]